jgi:hypothetical protein
MKLFCIKRITNRPKRLTFYKKLEKLGIKRDMPLSIDYHYDVITPQRTIVTVSFDQLDIEMFGKEHEVHEARNEKDFFELINKYILN